MPYKCIKVLVPFDIHFMRQEGSHRELSNKRNNEDFLCSHGVVTYSHVVGFKYLTKTIFFLLKLLPLTN